MHRNVSSRLSVSLTAFTRTTTERITYPGRPSVPLATALDRSRMRICLDEVNLLNWGFHMKSIKILLYRNRSQHDWSVEIDGTRHNHLSTAQLDDLIEYASVSAQQDLLAPEDPISIFTLSSHIVQ